LNTHVVAIAAVTLGTLSCGTKSSSNTHPQTNPPPPVERPIDKKTPPSDITLVQTNNPPAPSADHHEFGELPTTSLPKEAATWQEDLPVQMNARTAEGDIVYRGHRGCYVQLDFPEPPTSWEPAPIQTVPCPPVMGDFRWTQCRDGQIAADEAVQRCVCTVDGNPPPPPAWVHCPDPPAKG
jgi:hypothetical protein